MPEILHLGQNTIILCSRIIVVNVITFNFKFTQHATLTQTESKQEVTEITDKHAAEC